jgi:hypothetical protein
VFQAIKAISRAPVAELPCHRLPKLNRRKIFFNQLANLRASVWSTNPFADYRQHTGKLIIA